MAARTIFRPAARVLCLDAHQRLLLLRWRDPVRGCRFWEPPGGGLESGEDHVEAARRELYEETGLVADVAAERSTTVHREFCWRGQRFAGPEQFFLARLAGSHPISPTALTKDEEDALMEGRWLSWQNIVALTDPVRPSTLADVLTALDPSGPWNP